MTFTVTLATAVTEAVTVNYATSDGTATAGQDYTAVSNGSVTIAAGSTTAEFTVSVTGDETDELDETFNVTISMPEPEPNLNGGSSGEPVAAITGGDTAAAAGTILDDDPAVVTVAPKVDTVEEGEEAVFVLTRAGMTDGRTGNAGASPRPRPAANAGCQVRARRRHHGDNRCHLITTTWWTTPLCATTPLRCSATGSPWPGMTEVFTPGDSGHRHR